jgi:hypothetical protein
MLHKTYLYIFSSFLKKSELISAVWLGGWVAGALRLRNWEGIETSSFLQSIQWVVEVIPS